MYSKRLLSILIFLWTFLLAPAQISVSASGGTTGNTTGSISYSVGQVFYSSFSSPSGSLCEGVQIPAEFTVLGLDNNSSMLLNYSIFPNPSGDFIILKIPELSARKLSYTLSDIRGNYLCEGRITSDETLIRIQSLPGSIYLLSVCSRHKPIRTFRIIKYP